MKRLIRFALPIFLLVAAATGCAHVQKKETIFQTSTINALLKGIYDGDVTFGDLKGYGDFGIGTFNGLDGEMVALDGCFYQVKSDGIAYPADDSMKTPFSVVTFFSPDETMPLNKVDNYQELEALLDGMLPSRNIFYAIKIEGRFGYIKTRSVPGQQRPYPTLVEVVKVQSVFEFHDIDGTIVGFRSPDYVEGINVPGYHLHFITKDRRGGGHLLECSMQNLMAEVDNTNNFFMTLPHGGDFYSMDLTQKKKKDLETVEKGN
ncbi:acetolactate decarboxylase [bacterium]|nr:acetolactate decarboxylase [bacterium]